MSNLSEEEKKAIEFSEELHEVVKKAMEVKYRDNELKALQTIIKKQQKEIEEMRRELERHEKEQDYIFSWKYKIRSLLKQVNASLYHFKDSEKNNIVQRIKDRLEELLEESE